jgi:hypothetical protein
VGFTSIKPGFAWGIAFAVAAVKRAENWGGFEANEKTATGFCNHIELVGRRWINRVG